MNRGQLSNFFEAVAMKRLSKVEVDAAASNQHEFNGVSNLRAVFGESDRKNIPATFLWIGSEHETITAEGQLSWYDARRAHLTRTEYRLYYSSNDVTDRMSSDDLFFLGLRPNGDGLVVITAHDGTVANQLAWLFDIEVQDELRFEPQRISGNRDTELDFTSRFILEELGLDPNEFETEDLDSFIEPFGTSFPTTREFSELARRSLPELDIRHHPDDALVKLIGREEQLFRRLERRVVEERIGDGFRDQSGADVDGFIKFSLSVQNRRKSRAGQALEHHLEAIFAEHRLTFERGATTENNKKPDFLFPNALAYSDNRFPTRKLTMLGAKSSLKDRWRQVLSEADRIPEKHLCTLEPGISESQTSEMQASFLRLVIPGELHRTFSPQQQAWLMSLADFIQLVREREEA